MGTTSGHRFVIGHWPISPFGPFADVMHETPSGVRTLRAPTSEVAEFVGATYTFDRVELLPVAADRSDGRLRVTAGGVQLEIAIGGRTALGVGLRSLPRSLTRAPWWCAAVDPVARLAMRGVRTRGSAGGGRREWYGGSDQHRIAAVEGSLDGTALGSLADVWPPVRFGFSSTPRTPSIVAVTTTIELP